LFLSVDEVIVKENFKEMIQAKENEKAIKVYEEFGFKVKSIAYSIQI